MKNKILYSLLVTIFISLVGCSNLNEQGSTNSNSTEPEQTTDTTTTEAIDLNESLKPELHGLTDVVVMELETYDFYKDVNAVDAIDGNLDSEIIINLDPLGIDGQGRITNIGEFRIEYSVTNSNGQTTTEFRNVIVEDNGVSKELESCGTPIKGDYKIVWCDEFDYEGLPDSTKWGYDVGGHGWGNNELQYYTQDRLDNASVKDGVLTISAYKEPYGNNNYTSTRLVTREKGDWLYGRIEVKAKLPEGRGTWPAIWMLPTDWEYGGWPDSGEIDIMEHVGYEMNVIHGTVHTGNYNHMKGTQVGKQMRLDDVVNEYHVYAIEWDSSEIKFFIDGIHYHSFKNDENMNPDNDPMNWPFDKRFHLILNIAIGGNWGGAQGIDPNLTEAHMIVDYVRVYEKDYGDIDQEVPEAVSQIEMTSDSPAKTTLNWNEATDDLGIKHYEVYLNNELYDTTTVPSYTFVDLEQETEYDLEVIAVDLANKKSPATSFHFKTSTYPELPLIIQAEDYYEMDGIDLEDTTDIGGGENVGWIDEGDYLTYKVYVPESNTYKLRYRVASLNQGGEISLYGNDGTEFLTATSFNATGGWQNWITVESTEFYLASGVHTIKIQADQDGFNINWFEFILV